VPRIRAVAAVTSRRPADSKTRIADS